MTDLELQALIALSQAETMAYWIIDEDKCNSPMKWIIKVDKKLKGDQHG